MNTYHIMSYHIISYHTYADGIRPNDGARAWSFSQQTQSRACLASGLHHSWVLDPHKCRCARLPTFSSPCELAFRCRAEWTLTVETSWDVVVVVVVFCCCRCFVVVVVIVILIVVVVVVVVVWLLVFVVVVFFIR